MTGSDTAEKSVTDTGNTKQETAQARRAMIKSQLRTSGVNEEFVLLRMMDVARETFLPEARQPLAYTDRSIELEGGAIAPPVFYGKALQEAYPVSDDRMLVVEGGTGYLAALARPLVKSLDTVSAAQAAGGEVSGSYSLIMIDGAIEQLPDALVDCLDEGGRIVSGLLLRRVTRLASGRKVAGAVALQPVEDLGIPVLAAFDTPKKWSFS